jgi:hypothetical protein
LTNLEKKKKKKKHAKKKNLKQKKNKFLKNKKKKKKKKKTLHTLLICFHTPTPKGPSTSLEHQHPLIVSYFASTTKHHKASLSVAYNHNHLPNSA